MGDIAGSETQNGNYLSWFFKKILPSENVFLGVMNDSKELLEHNWWCWPGAGESLLLRDQ